MPPPAIDAPGDTSETPEGPSLLVYRACGIEWTDDDVRRFLSKTRSDGPHLLWEGGRSRGRGNTAWYGSFWSRGRTVRAHKFYGVAVLGLRPRPGIDHLDHTCCNSLCVSCLQVVPEWINLALRWVRVQVGLDEDRDRARERELLVEYAYRKGHDASELYLLYPDELDFNDTSDIDHWRTDWLAQQQYILR